jgi:hypothetical protein
MIPVNRETVLTAATIVCILGLVYLFKELSKTKEEMGNFKNFSAQVVRHLSPPPPMKPQPVPEPDSEPEPEPEPEEVKSEE